MQRIVKNHSVETVQKSVPVAVKIKTEKQVNSFERKTEQDFVPLTYAQNREARSLAMLEYVQLQKVYETFCIRISDNKLATNNDKLDSILGMLKAEIESIQTILFSKEKNKTEYFKKKEHKYLLSVLENPSKN